MFRYANWHDSREHWTRVGKQLGIEGQQLVDSDVAAIRDSLPFGPPNPLHVMELSKELRLFPDLGFPHLGRGNIQADEGIPRPGTP